MQARQRVSMIAASLFTAACAGAPTPAPDAQSPLDSARPDTPADAPPFDAPPAMDAPPFDAAGPGDATTLDVPRSEGGGVFPGAGRSCTGGEPTSGTTAALLFEAQGFAAGVTGGAAGCVYHVTTLANAGAGSLRAALERDEPLWIVFDLGGVIDLQSLVYVRANKTLDGRGRRVEITGQNLVFERPTTNIVIENLVFHDSAGDALTIDEGTTRVWVDHGDFGPAGDGQVDITAASTDVTVSWSHFHDHGLTMLIGASVADTGDTAIRVTLHHNWFDRTDERHPRLRYGRVHAFNNLYTDWLYYGIGSSQRGQVASEANIFVAGRNPDAIVRRVGSDTDDGLVRSSGDLLLGGATVETNNPAGVFMPSSAYSYTLEPADAALRARIESQAGWRDVPRP